MDFHKVETTANFVFDTPLARDLRVTDYGSSVFRVTLTSARWPRGTDSQARLTPEEFASQPSAARLNLGPGGEVNFSLGGLSLLASDPGRGFGVCGSKWVWAFRPQEGRRFYGLGEKHLGFELSGKRTKFWNTDEFGDFPMAVIEAAAADPSYSTFPVLLLKQGTAWAALVIDNPHGVFVNTGAGEMIFQPGAAPFVPELFFGSRDGAPDVWFLADETAPGLVRKIQTLQGRVAPPPVWALGHHQCRWGYRGPADLQRIADGFAAHGIPNDGLWLDIDYMDGFRVFTLNPDTFADPATEVAALNARGHRVVPILDPGLRRDPEFQVYAEAKAADILCQTPEGQDFVGYVWPGYTVFPDYSLAEGRDFWARQVKKFTDLGFGGYWIDMNDPATGSVPHDDMRFGRGERPHSSYHNQYALGMAEATKAGIEASRPGERTFVLSRSAYLSSGRHTALWTGDNISNAAHLRGTIALTLNLSVSGMPFNGPDVPGFAQDASDELMRTWYQLGFLFPFLRNHKVHDGSDQEPWSRDELTTRVVTACIRDRYRLLPYLYQVFLNQHRQGDPILRPLWYHDSAPAFEFTDDAFFVGPSILQAPFTAVGQTQRPVTLARHPAGTRWFSLDHGTWFEAGDTLVHHRRPEATPVHLACPSILPTQRGLRTTAQNDLAALDVVLVVAEGTQALAEYEVDDGLTTARDRGEVSQWSFRASLAGGQVEVTTQNPRRGFGGLSVRFLVLAEGPVRGLKVNGASLALAPEEWALGGSKVRVLAAPAVDL